MSATKLTTKHLKGSSLRCLLLTGRPFNEFADVLNALVHPYATFDPTKPWMPCGIGQPDEAKLGETAGFLSDSNRETVTNWWLKVRKGSNTPNWDMACNCLFEIQDGKRREGLVIVEAKAHSNELGKRDKCKAVGDNYDQIGRAIDEANVDLKAKQIAGGNWNLSHSSHYQLSNRFAWAWKIATLGVPVVLIYLGFLNAEEMSNRGTPFKTAKDWETCLRKYAAPYVPDDVWGTTFTVGKTPVIPLIRSLDLKFV